MIYHAAIRFAVVPIAFVWGACAPLSPVGPTPTPEFGPPSPYAAIVGVPSPPPSIAPEVVIEAPPPIEMGLPPAPGRYDGSIDVLHYDVELIIPPENDRIGGRTTIIYQSRDAGAHPVKLDLTGLEVVSVAWGGEDVSFTHENGIVSFTAPGGPAATDTLWAEVRSRGMPEDGLILRENVHGAPATFADNWPNRARFWFPAHDHPSDKATISFTVHAPEARKVVANGVQIGEATPADPSRTHGISGLQTWRWENRVPIPAYLMVIGAAEMVVLEQGVAACGMAPASPRADGCVEVTAWLFPPDVEHGQAVFARSGQMLEFYSDIIGPFPYEKLANVQSATRFGGMENASAIFYSEQAIAEGRDIEGTVAHEIAHQWFGNSVTPADWPHLWLSEGFASYYGPLFWEHLGDKEEFRSRIEANRAAYLESDVTHRPVVDEGVENLLDLLNRNSYQKGSLVLHMLRWVMGDEAFFEGVRTYYDRHAEGNAVSDDLRIALEELHGEPLDWFFDQWIYKPGYPVYDLEWNWEEGAGEVVLTVRQTQDDSWPTFRMPVEIEFDGPTGSERVVRWIEGREWTESIPLNFRPESVQLDPDDWLLMRTEEVVLEP